MADKKGKKGKVDPLKLSMQASMENLPIKNTPKGKGPRSPRNGKPKMI